MISDLFAYLWKNKLWWLLPPVVIFVIFGILVATATVSPVSSFVYMLF